MSSNHFIACQYIYIVMIKPANLPIGRNSPHFSKRGSLDKWEIGEDSSWWQVTLSTESSSARVCIPFQVRATSSYPVCIPYHHLTPPHHTSSEERMLEEESRGSVREWAALVSLGNCECLWQAAEDKWRHKSVSGEIIGDTWLGGNKKANLKIKKGAGSWLVENKLQFKYAI